MSQTIFICGVLFVVSVVISLVLYLTSLYTSSNDKDVYVILAIGFGVGAVVFLVVGIMYYYKTYSVNFGNNEENTSLNSQPKQKLINLMNTYSTFQQLDDPDKSHQQVQELNNEFDKNLDNYFNDLQKKRKTIKKTKSNE